MQKPMIYTIIYVVIRFSPNLSKKILQRFEFDGCLKKHVFLRPNS